MKGRRERGLGSTEELCCSGDSKRSEAVKRRK